VRWSALCCSGYRQCNTTPSLHLKQNSEWISYGLILLSLCIECGMQHKLLERCWVLSLWTYLFSSENFTLFCYSVKHFCNEEGIHMQIRTRYAPKLISMLKIFCFFSDAVPVILTIWPLMSIKRMIRWTIQKSVKIWES
jgi:hypothetical protein